MAALFESKEELRVFILDVIQNSPLVGRVDRCEKTLLAKKERNDNRDMKIDATYEVVMAMYGQAAERDRIFSKFARREAVTHRKLKKSGEGSDMVMR